MPAVRPAPLPPPHHHHHQCPSLSTPRIPLVARQIRKKATPPLEIRVPPGTVVKKKNNAGILGELVNPGDRLVVARGGKGGAGVRAPPKDAVLRERAREAKAARESGAELIAVSDVNWKQVGLSFWSIGILICYFVERVNAIEAVYQQVKRCSTFASSSTQLHTRLLHYLQ